MYEIVHKLINRATRRLAIDLGWARRHFEAQRGCVRVLTYHGVVPDEYADRPWVPSHYVSASQFEHQMAMLAEVGPSPVLSEALTRTQVEEDTPPAVCITFDDGMADNVSLALPILRKYGHKATFFLTTGYVGEGRILVNDTLRLLRLNGSAYAGPMSEACRRVLVEPGHAKTISVCKYAAELSAIWAQHRDEADPAALECLRLMSWDDARGLKAAGMEVGAHTVNHVILTREKRRTRRDEILESIARIRAKLHIQNVPFAYPNGLSGDYDGFDMDILAAIDVPYAVCEQPGWTHVNTPLLEIRRNCIGRHCSEDAFLEQVFGFNDATAASAA